MQLDRFGLFFRKQLTRQTNSRYLSRRTEPGKELSKSKCMGERKSPTRKFTSPRQAVGNKRHPEAWWGALLPAPPSMDTRLAQCFQFYSRFRNDEVVLSSSFRWKLLVPCGGNSIVVPYPNRKGDPVNHNCRPSYVTPRVNYWNRSLWHRIGFRFVVVIRNCFNYHKTEWVRWCDFC